MGEITKLNCTSLPPGIFNPLQQQCQSGAVAVPYPFEVDRDPLTRSKIAAQQRSQFRDGVKIQSSGKRQTPITGLLEFGAVTLLLHVCSDS